MFVHKRKITASEEAAVAEVEVAEEATDLLFEAEDVAELVAEITDEVVEVEVDGDDVIFNVGEDEYVVTPEGDEELVESSRKISKSKKPVAAARKVQRKAAPVKSSTRVIRKKVSK